MSSERRPVVIPSVSEGSSVNMTVLKRQKQDRIGRMDRIEQSLRVALSVLRATSPGEQGEQPLATPLSLRSVPHSLGPGDTLPDAEAVIFSILPILAILSCCFAVTPVARLVRQIMS